jgi:hypothetical protein
MNGEEMQCDHACRNTCVSLTDALQQETGLVRFYEQVITQCEDPEIRKFTRALAEDHSAAVIRIMQKLNEIKARSQSLDGVASSFGE